VTLKVGDRTAKLADSYVSAVKDVLKWAAESEVCYRAAVVQSAASTIRQEGRSIVQVGRDGADELREKV
jgi:hypothetical protein